jgi:hypothetical protein
VKKISRAGNSTMIAQGGTNTTSALPVVVSGDSNTNEYSLVSLTATVSGTDTAYTNTFGVSYVATPLVFVGRTSGVLPSGNGVVTITVTTSNLIASGLASGGVGTNNIPILIYGYKNTGTFP